MLRADCIVVGGRIAGVSAAYELSRQLEVVLLEPEDQYGFDRTVPGFHWLAGQGGYVIQTAPAMAGLCAATIPGNPIPDGFRPRGFEPLAFSPARSRRETAA